MPHARTIKTIQSLNAFCLVHACTPGQARLPRCTCTVLRSTRVAFLRLPRLQLTHGLQAVLPAGLPVRPERFSPRRNARTTSSDRLRILGALRPLGHADPKRHVQTLDRRI